MHLLTILLLLVAAIIPTTQAEASSLSHKTAHLSPDSKSSVLGCQFAVSRYMFGCDDSSGIWWACSCYYDPKLVTVVNCLQELSNDNNNLFVANLDAFSSYCEEFGEYQVNIDQLLQKYENGSKYIVNPATTNQSDGSPTTTVFYNPIELNINMTRGYKKDMFDFETNFVLSTYFGKFIAVYWSAIFASFAIYNKIIQTRSISLLNTNKKFNQKFINGMIKKYVTVPNTKTKHHDPIILKSIAKNPIFKYFSSALVPTRLESIILGAYILLNIILLVGDYNISTDSRLFPTISDQVLRYLADRSGIIAIDHVPILILLAGRNSILTWLSGLPYSSLIVYHKWISRGMFFNAFIHSVGYGIISAQRRTFWRNIFEERYYLFGTISTICAAVLMVQAMHYFRSRWYEVFLVTHIIFASIFLLGLVYHCLQVGWLEYTLLSILIWIFDRTLRIVKLYKFGVSLATITLVTPNTLKVTVPIKDAGKWKPFPGCYVFAYFLLPNTFWQSHPFSLLKSVTNEHEVILFIQVKGGITKKLYDYVTSHPGCKATIKVSLEGPYGDYYDLSKYKKVLFIAGGSGIPGPYYHLHEMLKGNDKQVAAADAAGAAAGGAAEESGTSKQDLKLYWSNKKFDDLKWFANELLELKGADCETCLYLTRERDATSIMTNHLLPKKDDNKDNNNEHDVTKTNSDSPIGISSEWEPLLSSSKKKPGKIPTSTSKTQAVNVNGSALAIEGLSNHNHQELLHNNHQGYGAIAAMGTRMQSESQLQSHNNSFSSLYSSGSVASMTLLTDKQIFEELNEFAMVKFGERPNLQRIIEENCTEMSYGGSGLGKNNSMAIVFCGPCVMCDDVRNVVSEVIEQYCLVIDIYEELQVW